MNKRIIAYLLVFALVIMQFGSSHISAEELTDNGTLYSDEIKAEAGKTVDIPVYIKNNPGIMGAGINVKYDKDAFTPISVKAGKLMSDGIFNDSIETSKDNSFKVLWSTTDDMKENGELFIMTFSVSEFVRGNQTIQLSIEQGDTFNETWEDVELQTSVINVDVSDPVYSEANITGSVEGNVECGTELNIPITITNNSSVTEATIDIKYDTNTFLNVKAESDLADTCEVEENSDGISVSLTGIKLSTELKTLINLKFDVADYTGGRYNFALESKNLIATGFQVLVQNTHINEKAIVYAGQAKYDSDNMISVPICIKNNSGIMGYKFTVAYDESVLKPESVAAGEKFTGNFDDNIGNKADSYQVLWSGIENVTGICTLFVAKFQVLSEENQKTQLKVSYSQDDTFNEQYKDLELDIDEIWINTTEVEVSATPSVTPTIQPSGEPTVSPSEAPTVKPSISPSAVPTVKPSVAPSKEPTAKPSTVPSEAPTVKPSVAPSKEPTAKPSISPSKEPTVKPSTVPSEVPTAKPSVAPSKKPTAKPSAIPSEVPTTKPSVPPTVKPSAIPTISPTSTPGVVDKYVVCGEYTGWGGKDSYPSSAGHAQGDGASNFYYTDSTNMVVANGYMCGLELMNSHNEVFTGASNEMSVFIKKMKNPVIKVTLKNGGEASSWNWHSELKFPSGEEVTLPANYLNSGYFALFGNDDVITKVEIYNQDKIPTTSKPQETSQPNSSEQPEQPQVSTQPISTPPASTSEASQTPGNTAGNEIGNGTSNVVNVPGEKAPKKPGKVKIKKVTIMKKGKVKITWKKVAGADYYAILYSTKKNFKGAGVAMTHGKKATLHLKKKKKYYICVRACVYGNSANNNQIVKGKWSKVKKVKTKK